MENISFNPSSDTVKENNEMLIDSFEIHFVKNGLNDRNYLSYFFSLYGSKSKYIKDYFYLMFNNGIKYLIMLHL